MAKLNDTTKDRLVKAIRLGLTNKLAAQYAGIGESTFYLWMEKARGGDPKYLDLLEALKRAEAQNAAECFEVIKRAAMDGTWTAAAWVLERRHNMVRDQIVDPPQEINTTELVDPTTEEGRAAIVAHVAELPEELILAALNRRAVAE